MAASKPVLVFALLALLACSFVAALPEAAGATAVQGLQNRKLKTLVKLAEQKWDIYGDKKTCFKTVKKCYKLSNGDEVKCDDKNYFGLKVRDVKVSYPC